MLWAIDVGNSQTVVGGWDGSWRHCWRFSTDPRRTGDEWAAILSARAAAAGGGPKEGDRMVIGSVVPSAEPAWQASAELLGVGRPAVLRSGEQVGLEVLCDPPHGVGADRIANALQAKAEGRLPCLVVDVGTATTLDAVDAEGRYLGGAILPGPELSVGALASQTAKLGSVVLEAPSSAIGRTTASAIQSGVLLGHAGAVDRLVAAIRAELGGECRTVATGGLSKFVSGLCQEPLEWKPDWTLDGLRRAWEPLSLGA